MATDGVKIIDGDTAFDLYSGFMDAYDEGADGVALRKMYDRDKEECSFSDFEYEICVTVYALAFWEIGELIPEILSETERVISKGAGVADWTEEIDEKAGKARQKELDKLFAKIKQPNNKIRKRKKYKKVENLLFNYGDVLTFQFPDKTYGLTVVADVMQYRGECNYMLCRTTFKSTVKPTLGNIPELRIVGSLVPSGSNIENPEIQDKLTNITAEEVKNGTMERLMAELYAGGLKLKMPWVLIIDHKNLMKNGYADNFEKIGEVPLHSSNGSSRSALDYSSFCEGFVIQDVERNCQGFLMPETSEFTVGELIQQPYHG